MKTKTFQLKMKTKIFQLKIKIKLEDKITKNSPGCIGMGALLALGLKSRGWSLVAGLRGGGGGGCRLPISRDCWDMPPIPCWPGNDGGKKFKSKI